MSKKKGKLKKKQKEAFLRLQEELQEKRLVASANQKKEEKGSTWRVNQFGRERELKTCRRAETEGFGTHGERKKS